MTDHATLLNTVESNLQCSLNRYEGVLREHGNSLKKLIQTETPFSSDLDLGISALENLDDLVKAREYVSALSQTQGHLVQAKQSFQAPDKVLDIVCKFAADALADASRRLHQGFEVPTEQAVHSHWVSAWAGVGHILTGQPPLRD